MSGWLSLSLDSLWVPVSLQVTMLRDLRLSLSVAISASVSFPVLLSPSLCHESLSLTFELCLPYNAWCVCRSPPLLFQSPCLSLTVSLCDLPAHPSVCLSRVYLGISVVLAPGLPASVTLPVFQSSLPNSFPGPLPQPHGCLSLRLLKDPLILGGPTGLAGMEERVPQQLVTAGTRAWEPASYVHGDTASPGGPDGRAVRPGLRLGGWLQPWTALNKGWSRSGLWRTD